MFPTLLEALREIRALAEGTNPAVVESVRVLELALLCSFPARAQRHRALANLDADGIRIAVLRALRAAEAIGTGDSAVRAAGDVILRALDSSEMFAAMKRHAHSPAESIDVISEDAAARMLPIRRCDGANWLRREGLSVLVEGRRMVVKASLLARLSAPARATSPTPGVASQEAPRRRKARSDKGGGPFNPTEGPLKGPGGRL